MTEHQPTDDSLESIAEPICVAHGVELVQIARVSERGSPVLRVLIDRPGSEEDPSRGVTVGDCQGVSRDLATALDVHDPIVGQYRLEVSSPGVDRPLVKPKDYERFRGREVRVKTRTPHSDSRGGVRRKFEGMLLGIDGESVRLEVEGSELQLPHSDIVKANVVYRFD